MYKLGSGLLSMFDTAGDTDLFDVVPLFDVVCSCVLVTLQLGYKELWTRAVLALSKVRIGNNCNYIEVLCMDFICVPGMNYSSKYPRLFSLVLSSPMTMYSGIAFSLPQHFSSFTCNYR